MPGERQAFVFDDHNGPPVEAPREHVQSKENWNKPKSALGY